MQIQTLGLSPPAVRSTAPTGQALPLAQPYTSANWSLLFGGNDSDAGEVVNEQTALSQ